MVNDRLQPRSDWSSAGRLAILSSVLFLSGIGSLIFETLWLRLSGLAFGNSVWSAALILSSFMAGLALGSAISAPPAPPPPRPLHLFPGVEKIVGVFCCSPVVWVSLLGGWVRAVFFSFSEYH